MNKRTLFALILFSLIAPLRAPYTTTPPKETPPMHQSVQEAFIRFTAHLEGATTWMYQDVKGLVTTGYGNLIDTPEDAQQLTWYRMNGTVATPAEVLSEWSRIKSIPGKTQAPYTYWQRIAYLNIAVEELNVFAIAKLKQFETAIKQFPAFKNWESLCSDAQLGVLSMLWAEGPGNLATFTKFLHAISVGDFTTAANECKMNETHNPGLVPRNVANKALFMNAAAIERLRQDETVLYYPQVVGGTTTTTTTIPIPTPEKILT